MIGTVTGSKIELPDWLGCLSFERGGARPFTVERPDRGCDLSHFGRSSIALFDGYLFDRDDLIRALGVEKAAHDAVLAAAAYQRWGAGCLDHLDGCYLIAIWDEARDTLVLGHDAMGRRPVFYSRTRGGLGFSSNVFTLAESGVVSTAPNRLSMALEALRYWPEAGETFFEDIRRVRPGHYLEVSGGGAIHEHKYFDPLPHADEPWLPDRDVLDEFEPRLTRAVARSLQLAPQGIMLSGGVDSVTIAGIAASQLRAAGRAPLIAVSGQTGYALSGEEELQPRVADALGMRLDVSAMHEWTGGINEVALSLGETPGLPCPTHIYWVGTYTRFYRRTAARDTPVLLTGSGGDNWLGVADSHAADLIWKARVRRLARFVSADVGTAGRSLSTSLRQLGWAYGVRPIADSIWAKAAPGSKLRYHREQWSRRLPAWLCPDPVFREAFIDRLMARRVPSLTDDGRIPGSFYRQSVRRPMENPYLHHENEVAYHVETSCGLRLISPYHDRRLVSFFNRISPDALLHGGRYKGLLRPVVARHLPGLGLERQRKDYSAETRTRTRRELAEGVRTAWKGRRFDHLSALGIVDERSMTHAFASHMPADVLGLTQMFTLMSLEDWTTVHNFAEDRPSANDALLCS